MAGARSEMPTPKVYATGIPPIHYYFLMEAVCMGSHPPTLPTAVLGGPGQPSPVETC